ncbi:MAG: sulfite reductase [Desulfobacterium sp.]|nr:sulfite reductase [Desulfobacterium sp.]
MKWNQEAEDAVKKVPFFVRKKVIGRIEKEAAIEGKSIITMVEVNSTRARFVSGMDSEIKGYQADTCFGQNGCPNRIVMSEILLKKIEDLFKKEDILGFLRKSVPGALKFHHEFRTSVSECPNACSQPQIKDIGILGASLPMQTDIPCTACGACEEVCKENAILIHAEEEKAVIDYPLCVKCGKCITVCPTGTIAEEKKGFRIQLGGKLGRHPRLASEIPGLFNEDEVLEVVRKCIDFYKKNSTKGKRFSEIYQDPGFLNADDRDR